MTDSIPEIEQRIADARAAIHAVLRAGQPTIKARAALELAEGDLADRSV